MQACASGRWRTTTFLGAGGESTVIRDAEGLKEGKGGGQSKGGGDEGGAGGGAIKRREIRGRRRAWGRRAEKKTSIVPWEQHFITTYRWDTEVQRSFRVLAKSHLSHF